MARPPDPLRLKIARGELGHHKKPSAKKQKLDDWGGDLMLPPKELGQKAKMVWKHIIKVMPKGHLRKADKQALIMYCNAVVRYSMYEADLALHGPRIESERGWKANPSQAGLKQTEDFISKMNDQLGLTPAARARLGLEAEEKDDELDEL